MRETCIIYYDRRAKRYYRTSIPVNCLKKYQTFIEYMEGNSSIYGGIDEPAKKVKELNLLRVAQEQLKL